MDLDAVSEELYGLHPDAFVGARDEAVARARADGDKDLARAIGHLRRPTRAAWLANLLARNRGEQLDGLLALAGDLADAQRTLDGGALRALSAQRRRLVGAMAREGGRLAAQNGDAATESVLRDLEGILDAALADPAVAREVRSGRLTRTVRWSGFGPEPGAPSGRGGSQQGDPPAAGREQGHPAAVGTERDDAATGDAERERRDRERAERERDVADAERAEADARDIADTREAERADAEAVHTDAKARVADLAAELESARERERAAAAAAREATAAAKDAARDAGTATTRVERARARLAEITT